MIIILVKIRKAATIYNSPNKNVTLGKIKINKIHRKVVISGKIHFLI